MKNIDGKFLPIAEQRLKRTCEQWIHFKRTRNSTPGILPCVHASLLFVTERSLPETEKSGLYQVQSFLHASIVLEATHLPEDKSPNFIFPILVILVLRNFFLSMFPFYLIPSTLKNKHNSTKTCRGYSVPKTIECGYDDHEVSGKNYDKNFPIYTSYIPRYRCRYTCTYIYIIFEEKYSTRKLI